MNRVLAAVAVTGTVVALTAAPVSAAGRQYTATDLGTLGGTTVIANRGGHGYLYR